MSVFRRKKNGADKAAEWFDAELKRQQEKHRKEEELRQKLADALERNHLAQLMYEVLSEHH